ncbi:MAG TPA: TadE/TadG family type IV pilus assembly protein [Brevundimonas sp.]|jgi:Flp pilus assembly protein TadG
MKPGTPGARKPHARSREGATAVEFAMIAFPFFFMLFAILEIGLLFVTDSMLENAVIETGRLIRTGVADNSRMTADQFKASLCTRMSIFSADCASQATVDVRVITQFRNVAPPDPLANGTSFDKSGLTYLTGQPGSLVLIRVWYSRPLITPFMAQALSKLGDGNTILTATTTFRNEPFNAATPLPAPATP